MADEVHVNVVGMAAVLLKLRLLEAGLPEMAREAEHDSADVVADTARRRVPLGPPEGGHVKTTFRAYGPEVRGGGPGFPYTGWLEYGGRVGKDHRVYRPYLQEGRYIYPSYLQHYHRVTQLTDRALVNACQRAGLDVDR